MTTKDATATAIEDLYADPLFTLVDKDRIQFNVGASRAPFESLTFTRKSGASDSDFVEAVIISGLGGVTNSALKAAFRTIDAVVAFAVQAKVEPEEKLELRLPLDYDATYFPLLIQHAHAVAVLEAMSANVYGPVTVERRHFEEAGYDKFLRLRELMHVDGAATEVSVPVGSTVH